jgi:hypothetical protein
VAAVVVRVGATLYSLLVVIAGQATMRKNTTFTAGLTPSMFVQPENLGLTHGSETGPHLWCKWQTMFGLRSQLYMLFLS